MPATLTQPTPSQPMNKQEFLDALLQYGQNIPEDDIPVLQERLERKRAVDNQSHYHKIILARIYQRPGQKIPDLPGGKYETYILAKGRHFRNDKDDVAVVRAEHIKRCEEAKKLGHNSPDFPEIIQREFKPGDPVTPQDDAEALMMLQDPEKFHRVTDRDAPDQIAMLLAGQSERDAIIAKLQAENEALRKKSNGNK